MVLRTEGDKLGENLFRWAASVAERRALRSASSG